MLRARTEYKFASDTDMTDLPAEYYDAILQLAVAYVQLNYLNMDSSAAKGQAAAAVQLLPEASDRRVIKRDNSAIYILTGGIAPRL